MRNKFLCRMKRTLASVLASTILITMVPMTHVSADTSEKYPYTIFAASAEEGAITVNAGNFCVNGSIATNGTIVSAGNMNINGTKLENVNEQMIHIGGKIVENYFMSDDVDVYSDDYIYEDVNININNPLDVEGVLELTGNINLNTGIKAVENVELNGEVKNSNNSVIYSETGDIIIDSTNVNLGGLIYAPYGKIEITAQNLNMNNVIVIANTVKFNCPSVNANYSSSMAEFVGIESETENEPEEDVEIKIVASGQYNSETNCIDIIWESNNLDGYYEVFSSDDDINYISEVVISDASTYQYPIKEGFDKKYFKVIFTTDSGESGESDSFVVIKPEDTKPEDTEPEDTDVLLDSDGDRLPDLYEKELGTDSNNDDTDNDGLKDGWELYYSKTSPIKYDSVSEGISDADLDMEADGLTNVQEAELGTDPQEADTDKDNFGDGDEVNLYGTDPVVPDTDNDGLKDGDEQHIGLDPKNPQTFGIPDSEYIVEQNISDDSMSLVEINTKDSPYRLSIDITAAGYVEGNLIGQETNYAKVIENDAMLGMAPELIYTEELDIEKVTLKFEISEEYKENVLDLFPEEEQLEGLKRLNVFKYFEEHDMLLPIETKFDVENNLVYAETDELGTYCIMDMEMWLESFGLSMDSYQATPMLMSLDTDTVGAPIDVVFVLQTAGDFQTAFNSQRKKIISAMNLLNNEFDNVRVCVITFNTSGADFLKTDTNGFWFTDSADLKVALEAISYQSTSQHVDRDCAFEKLLKEVKFKENSKKFTFLFTNGDTIVDSSYYEEIGDYEKYNINYSEMHPNGYYYVDGEHAKAVINAVEKTNGLYEICGVDVEKVIFEHICSIVEPVQGTEFSVIVPTGWKTIVLRDVLDSQNGVNSDKDTLTDWDEVVSEKISKDTKGNIVLPTLQECINYVDKPYAEEGLTRFRSKYVDAGMPSSVYDYYWNEILNNTYILPIHSDPIVTDSDWDGLEDDRDPQPLYSNKYINFGSEAYLEDLYQRLKNTPYYLNDYQKELANAKAEGKEQPKGYYDTLIDLMIADINNSELHKMVSDENWDAFCELFNECILGSGEIDKERHYFRNKLNRAPATLEEMILEYEDWVLCEVGDSLFHMNGEDGVYNMKFVSDCGKYEAVYNKDGVLLTEDNDPVNMGTYNYAGYMDDEGGHKQFDVYPYIAYGNSTDSTGWGCILPTDYYLNSEAVKYREEIEKNIVD